MEHATLSTSYKDLPITSPNLHHETLDVVEADGITKPAMMEVWKTLHLHLESVSRLSRRKYCVACFMAHWIG